MNDVTKIENLSNNKEKHSSLLNYLISRTLLVFFLKLLIGIIKNNIAKIQFFFQGYSFYFWRALFGWFVVLITLVITIVFINLVFTILRLKDNKVVLGDYYVKYGFLGCIKLFFRRFYFILMKNYYHELDRDRIKNLTDSSIKDTFLYRYEYNHGRYIRKCKLTKPFLIIAIFSLLFYKGNPFLNNYYGVYNSYVSGFTREFDEKFSEEHLFVIEKKDWQEEELQWNYFIEEVILDGYEDFDNIGYDDLKKEEKNRYNELDFHKRGYIFKEAAVFDGFHSYRIDSGILSYYKYLSLYALEKIIITLLFFLLPFLTVILYSFFNTVKQKHLYIIAILVLFPVLLYIGYFGDILQISIFTTFCLVFISIVNTLPLTSSFKMERYLWENSKLMKVTSWLSILSIFTYVSFEVYYYNWDSAFLLIPLLLWWGSVMLLVSITLNEK